jgi:hypothetical protein
MQKMLCALFALCAIVRGWYDKLGIGRTSGTNRCHLRKNGLRDSCQALPRFGTPCHWFARPGVTGSDKWALAECPKSLCRELQQRKTKGGKQRGENKGDASVFLDFVFPVPFVFIVFQYGYSFGDSISFRRSASLGEAYSHFQLGR